MRNRVEFHSSTCCVCRHHLDKGSTVVSSEDRSFVFLTRNVWIPEGARSCPDHIVHNQLTKQAVDSIRPLSVRNQEWNSSQVQALIQNFQNLYSRRKPFDFDNGHDLSNDAYPILTSLSKDAFDNLVEIVSTSSSARNSAHRSIRTAIGIYLCKLRLGLSNSFLSIMFDLADKRSVSCIVNSARQSLSECFTPYNLGFNHMTRREIIDNHTTTIARQLISEGEKDTAILVIDGTYVYIQVRKYSCTLFITLFSF